MRYFYIMEEKEKLSPLEQIVADHEIIIGELTKQTGQLIVQTKIGWILLVSKNFHSKISSRFLPPESNPDINGLHP